MSLRRNPLALALAAALMLSGCGTSGFAPSFASKPAAVSASAHKDWKLVKGVVTKLLPDDTTGSPHQHFLVKLSTGVMAKVAHNTDLAPKVPVEVGDAVSFKCEYIKQKPYDIIHWTHYDPQGGEGGYIELKGRKYDRL